MRPDCPHTHSHTTHVCLNTALIPWRPIPRRPLPPSPLQYSPTIGDVYTKDVEVNGAPRHITIDDTAGQEAYADLKREKLTTGDVRGRGVAVLCALLGPRMRGGRIV